MKKILKAIKLILLTPFVLIFAILIILSVKYSPTYVYRLITQNVADVFDYKKYENRIIKSSGDPFQFAKQLDEDYVESLFQDRIERSGFNSFDEWAEKSQTTALIFIRKDTVLYEKYFNGFSRDSYFHSQSMAKSFISFLIGAAIDDGLIGGVDDSMTKYIPELKERNPDFEKITIKNLLEMRSGLGYNTSYIPGINIHAPWHDEAVGYYHPNVRKLLLKKLDIAREPGESFQYNNYNTSYLGLIIERATNKTVSEYLQEKLWSEVMEYDALFSIDSKKSGFEYMPSRLIARAIITHVLAVFFFTKETGTANKLFQKIGLWNLQEKTNPFHAIFILTGLVVTIVLTPITPISGGETPIATQHLSFLPMVTSGKIFM